VASTVRSITNPAPWSATRRRSPTRNRFATARPAAGIFFPLRPALRLDGHSYTPDLQQRIVTLAGRLKSFELVAVALQVAANIAISGRQVQCLTHGVGADLVRQRDEQTAQYRRRELPCRVTEVAPVVVVETDGGRLGTRQHGAGPGVHQVQAKEDKIACLVSMRSQTHDVDPQPQPPPGLRDARRVARLVQQFQGQAPAADEAAVAAPPTAEPRPASADRPQAPQRLVRTCVATMHNSRRFGPMVAAEAQARGFFEASRQAFVGDGQHYNWQIQRAYFPHFVAITDFLHVLCYLYRAAWVVGADDTARWRQFESWMATCWQGRVADVLAELTATQERLGRPPPELERQEGDVWQVVAEVVCYLKNNQSRMDYPRYRREGLPVTSSWVESLVGEFNSRVKGRDKYWNRPEGVEAILQVRAAVLSDDERLGRYFAERSGHLYRRRAS
jgi:hypothetical protein